MTRIYLASSWRNTYQPSVLAALRAAGHDVYDFRNPASVIRGELVDTGAQGFGWRQILEGPIDTAEKLRGVLAHPIVEGGFDRDYDAMRWADACVLLLPCGNSAHLEAGWMAGVNKPVVVLAPELREPELMYKCFDTRQSRYHREAQVWRGLDDTDENADQRGWQTPLFSTVDEVIDFLPRMVCP